ncbi:MAG: hypothetical protein ACLPXB_19660 [Thiobacillaceae bacterium]
MEMRSDQQKPPDVLQERRTSNELVEQIRKLRWMGLEEEAVIVQNELNLRRETADSVVAASHDTD